MFSASDSSSEMDCTEAEIEKKRGVKRGSRRGPYSKAAKNDTKLRIIAAAEKDSDWKAAARANGVSIATAYGWLRRADENSKKPGDTKNSKLTKDDVERMLTYVEENPLITLTEVKSKIQNKLNIIISTTTIHEYLECRLYTVKKFFWSPAP